MAELSTVARPYAEALFAAACDDKAGLDVWAGWVNQMAQVAVNPDVHAAMSDPRLGEADRARVFASLLQGEVSPFARNFINLLVQNDRLLLLPDIAEQFQALRNCHEGMAQVDIASAFALTPEQLKDLLSALELKFGLKLKPHVTVDSSLIGGVRVAVGDQVLDTSVQAQLARMRDTLVA
jgi:F-type H+-transporting ATPase subunit delta